MHARLVMGIRALAAAIAASILLGCPAAGPDDGPERGDMADSASGPVARVAPTPWYRRARALDLTGDGRADSARLEAIGARPDSLRITLALIVDGTVKHREDWGSSYELALIDSSHRDGPRSDVLLRARLDSVLSGVRVQRFDAPGVRLMAEDSAILAGLEPRPTHRISFSYGVETTVRLAWDAPRRRFVRLWSCC